VALAILLIPSRAVTRGVMAGLDPQKICNLPEMLIRVDCYRQILSLIPFFMIGPKFSLFIVMALSILVAGPNPYLTRIKNFTSEAQTMCWSRPSTWKTSTIFSERTKL
jgi:hypothetical protein